MGREEIGHVIVEEGEPCSPAAEGVARQIDLAAPDPSFELGCTIATVPEPFYHAFEVSEVVEIDAGLPRQLLSQCQCSGLFTELPLPEQV